MWGWLTSLLGVWSLVKSVFSAGFTILGWLKDWFINREIQKRNEAIDKAEEKIKNADSIEDDQKRIEEKADAACELEKIANPDSDCGGSTQS